MTILSELNQAQVQAVFTGSAVGEATALIQDFALNVSDAALLERIRAAAVRVSGGDLNRLLDALALADTDWRDLLVGAGFANDVGAHLNWKPQLGKG